jgi:NitT/TauT family transport system ATP-binding protein
LLSVEAVRQAYAGANGDRPTEALAGISFRVCEGEFICIVGPSGCGKTTLLRILGGLLAPSSGQVRLHGETLQGPRREIGYVFQHANLMPWRTILSNVALPLEIQRVPAPSAEARARQVLSLVGLEGFEQAYPRQLSGGMAQRAALARTLVYEPSLLLLDEPFGALDAITRERMTLELQRIRQALPYTAVMVTHSISEAVFLAGRVLVMSQRPGRIVAEVGIPFPYPRQLEIMGTPEFAALTQTVRRAIVTDP